MDDREKFIVDATSPAGSVFRHSFDLFPMAKLVAQSLVRSGYSRVFIVAETGKRYGEDEIMAPGFEP